MSSSLTLLYTAQVHGERWTSGFAMAYRATSIAKQQDLCLKALAKCLACCFEKCEKRKLRLSVKRRLSECFSTDGIVAGAIATPRPQTVRRTGRKRENSQLSSAP